MESGQLLQAFCRLIEVCIADPATMICLDEDLLIFHFQRLFGIKHSLHRVNVEPDSNNIDVTSL